MEHLRQLYNDKRELFYELLKNKVKITLRTRGKIIQVFYNKDVNEVEYHKGSSNSCNIGPKIDEFSKLMDKSYDNTINILNDHIDVIKTCDLLTFEVLDDYIILWSCIKDTKLVDDNDELKKLSKSLNCILAPVLFDGKLDINQQNQISSWCNGDMDEDVDFKEFIKDLLSDNNNSKVSFPIREYNDMYKYIKGIVLDFYVTSKIGQYKMIDPKVLKDAYDNKASNKEEYEKNKDNIEALQKYIQEYMNSNVASLSLDENFILMVTNPKRWSRLIELANKVPASNFDNMNIDKIDDEVKKILRRGGVQMSIIYTNYILMYCKKRNDNYIINKEFQDQINNTIVKIEK